MTVGQALSQASFGDLVNADGVGLICVGAAAAYLLAVGPWRHRFANAGPVPRRQITYFLLGILSMYAAVGGPVDFLGDHFLFSAHMVEHVLLLFVLPPLVLLGTPDWLARAILRPRWLRRSWAWLTHPVTALLVFNLILGLWHFPGPYDLTLRNNAVHFSEHAMFVIIGLIAWWPVLSPLPELPPLHEGVQLVYLLVEELSMTVLFALITFAPKPVYPFYVHVRQRVLGLSPLEDQQIGGAIMRLGSMLTFGVVGARCLTRWIQRDNDELPAYAFVPAEAAARAGLPRSAGSWRAADRGPTPPRPTAAPTPAPAVPSAGANGSSPASPGA